MKLQPGIAVKGALVVGLAFAWSPVAPATEVGAAAYAQSCARCHSDPRSLAASVRGRTSADAATGLDSFLSHHTAEDAAARKQIVDYLIGLRG